MSKVALQSEEDEAEGVRRRTGGRSARVRAAVMTATLEELEEKGYAQVTIPAIAVRAGVHDSSIYRRWGSVQQLVTEATFALFDETLPIPDQGPLDQALVTVLCAVVDLLDSPRGRAAMQFNAVTMQDPVVTRELHHLWTERLSVFHHVFARAVEWGEWPAGLDPQPLVDALIGLVHVRMFLLREPVDRKRLQTTVAMLLGAPWLEARSR